MARQVRDYVENLYEKSYAYGKVYNLENIDQVDQYIESRRHLKRNWEYLRYMNLNFSGEVHQSDSDYAQTSQTPSHHTEFFVDQTLPGKVFESAKSDVSFDLYQGDIAPESLQLELVITERESDNVSTVTMTNTGEVSPGTFHYHAHFDGLDGKVKRIRVRAIPKVDQVHHKFEFGLCHWL